MKESPHPDAGHSAGDAELMYVRCSVCGKWMDVKPGQMNMISHSFCADCYAEEMRKLGRDG